MSMTLRIDVCLLPGKRYPADNFLVCGKHVGWARNGVFEDSPPENPTVQSFFERVGAEVLYLGADIDGVEPVFDVQGPTPATWLADW